MAVDLSAANGWYKVRYGKKNSALPSVAKVQQLIPFQQRAKTGKSFNEPVLLRSSHGLTIKGGTARGTVYPYNAPQSPQMEEVSISGVEITMRDQVAIGAVAAAIGGDAAYGPLVDETVMQLMESHRYYLELGMLYGQSTGGIGVTASAATSGANASLVISAATWAPGIWARGEKMRLDAYDGSTLINDSAAGAYFTVETIDMATRTIVVSGEASDITALVTAAADTVLIPHGGAGATGLFTGIDRVVSNTGSLHGIDASAYSLWKGNLYNASSAAITLGMLHTATVQAVDRGLEGRFDWLLPTAAWARIANDQNGLRRYMENTGREMKSGTNKLTFYGANGAEMTLTAHSMIKTGEAFGLTPDEWVRGGESDLVDTLPGAPKDQFFHNVPGYSALEILNFSSQFLFCRKPSRQVKIYGANPAAS